MSHSIEAFYVSTSMLIKLGGSESILLDLIDHLTLSNYISVSNIPDDMVVLIEQNGLNEKTTGIRYYKHAADDRPFMTMGSAHRGYYITCALIRAIGRPFSFKIQVPDD